VESQQRSLGARKMKKSGRRKINRDRRQSPKYSQLKSKQVGRDLALQEFITDCDSGLFQQGREGYRPLGIKRDYFRKFDYRLMPDLPIVLSIDPGRRSGQAKSFSVIQAWSPFGDDHLLFGQWREQATFKDLKKSYWDFVWQFRPSVALIRIAGNGPALISNAKRQQFFSVVGIVPDDRSMMERLVAHLPLIRNLGVHLLESASWKENYINEFLEFPEGKFDNQIHATTQYLDWVGTNPIPKLSPIGK
jgi:phage terminase large subunit-like protein